MISDVNDVISYTMSYDSANVLRKGSSISSIIERVCLICEEAKSNACRYLKITGEGINLTLHTRVIIEGIAVEVAEF